MATAPPPYEEATKGSSLVGSSEREAPPAYDQLFGISNLKEAKRNSSNNASLAVNFFDVLCGTVCCAVCMVVLAALPVAMIVIGAVYLDNCEGQRLIPIWLIVFGSVSVVQTIIDVIKRCFKTNRNDDEEGSNRGRNANRSGSCLESGLGLFLFVWIILGSVWVFGYYNKWQSCRHDDTPEDCCDDVPYIFSFVSLIVLYSVSVLICCCCCCCIFCCAILAAGGGGE